MKEKDYEYIAKLERAISKKYGKITIQNPRSSWDERKEESFLRSVKNFYQRINLSKDERGEYKPHLNDNRCEICQKHHYFMNLMDEVSFVRHRVCRSCFLNHIEGRLNSTIKTELDKEGDFKN
tara:strand:- start:165 stop:533 length:369 start_codon:yes stop_codon:yes gene_type:complete